MIRSYMIAIIAVVFGIIFLIGLAITAFVCWLLMRCFQRIPAQFRTMEPAHVWLLMIPCFNLAWVFFVYQKLPESFKNYFNAVGRHDVGDCGKQLGMWYCICFVGSLIPYLGALAALASFVLLIMFLIKAHELKAMIPEGGQMPANPLGPIKPMSDNPYA